MTVELTDIIGLPYRAGGTSRATGVCCLWTVRTCAERIFADFDPSELPLTDDEVSLALARDGAGLARWRVVGTSWVAASKLGDILRGDKDGESFCAIVVGAASRTVCTANAERGVFRCAARALQGVTTVYRRS